MNLAMLKKIRITLVLMSILFVTAIATLSQQPTTNENSANNSPSTQPVVNIAQNTNVPNSPDDVCEQRLAKTLDALLAEQELRKRIERENQLLTVLVEKDNEIINAQKNALAAKDTQISILEKKSKRRVKIFWGLISF